jgi:hypothetical protein
VHNHTLQNNKLGEISIGNEGAKWLGGALMDITPPVM